MSGVVPLYAFVAWTGKKLCFLFQVIFH